MLISASFFYDKINNCLIKTWLKIWDNSTNVGEIEEVLWDERKEENIKTVIKTLLFTFGKIYHRQA